MFDVAHQCEFRIDWFYCMRKVLKKKPKQWAKYETGDNLGFHSLLSSTPMCVPERLNGNASTRRHPLEVLGTCQQP